MQHNTTIYQYKLLFNLSGYKSVYITHWAMSRLSSAQSCMSLIL